MPEARPTIPARIRSMARIWSLLVWALALILLLGPRAEDSLPAGGGNAVPLLLLISLLGLGVAWRWEIWGAAVNLGAYLAIAPVYRVLHAACIGAGILIALSPVILPGILYVIAWGMEKRKA